MSGGKDLDLFAIPRANGSDKRDKAASGVVNPYCFIEFCHRLRQVGMSVEY
jgi:hypothetical protein